MNVLGVYREPMYSPGRTDDDARIIEMTVRQLAMHGHAVHLVPADRLDARVNGADCVVTMAESDRALGILQEWENRGTRIVNTAAAVYGCRRDALVRVLQKSGVPLPESRLLPVRDVHRYLSFDNGERWWLKRADVHSTRPGDVVQAGSPGELLQAVDRFAGNGIERVIVQQHAEGEIIKFYGIADETYFSAFIIPKHGAGSAEEVRYPCLQALAARAARAVGLEVYGGDAVVTSDGRFLLVDLNDWPSFSRCADAASGAIAAYIDGTLRQGAADE